MENLNLEQLDNLAKECYYKNQFHDALICYARAFVDYPNLALAYNNYGNILREMGYPVPARGFLENAIKLDPNDRVAPLNLAISYLINGEMKEGWERFESRWRFRNHEHLLVTFSPRPRWQGQDFIGKTIVVTCEEGDGDNFQFIRYAKLLHERGAKVIAITELNIIRFFQANLPFTVLNNVDDVVPEHDYWCPILSLPEGFGANYENGLISGEPYMTMPDSEVKRWKKILGKKTKPRIGFSYRGRTKSFPSDVFINFMQNHPEYEWVSFQTGCEGEELIKLDQAKVTGHFDKITDWYDTAGIIKNLDAIVCVDTGLAHIAGSMGVPVFVLLDQYKTCWRWLLNREDTPWYDSVNLIRQKQWGVYDEQLDRLADSLSKIKPKK